MKKNIIIVLLIIVSWYGFVQFSKYLEKQQTISINKVIDGRIISYLIALDNGLKQFEIEKAEYPSEGNFDSIFGKKYIKLEKKDFLKEFNFIYEVSEDLKNYKISAIINDNKKSLNDGGIDDNRFEKGNNLKLNIYKYKIILGEDKK